LIPPRFILLFSALFVMCSGAPAQITITKTDVDANYVNHTWYSISDTNTLTLNLGTASSSAQTFNFSAITIAATATSDTSAYLPPAGHLRAGDFPSASACVTRIQSSSQSGFTITLTTASYFTSQTDGAYALGSAIRQQITPTPPPPFVADTTNVYKNVPKQLEIPLPLTLGTSRTGIDTVTQQGGITQVTSLTYTANGFGTLTLPRSGSAQAIRIVRDRVVWITQNGITTRQPAERSIAFVTQNLTQISFDVDTTYAVGTVQLQNYAIQTQTPLTAVNESPRTMPQEIRLLQNYPNPFNPSTSIAYALPARSIVRLEIYNVLGEKIGTLVNGEQEPGDHTIPWSAASVGSGVYFYRLSVQNNGTTFTGMKRMVLLK
jgi:hypothetical protein